MSLKSTSISIVFLVLLSTLVVASWKYESNLKHFPLGASLIKQREAARQQVGLNKLNIYMTRDYRPLLECAKNPSCSTTFDPYIAYFQLINQYMPAQPESYALLGFCYAHKNDGQKSFEYYKKSLMISPTFFWNYYNLALLLWSQGETQKASVLLQQALKLDPKDSLNSILSSKIYRDILASGDSSFNVLERLNEGYRKAASYLERIHQGQTLLRGAPPIQFL